jgi:nucleotide-binding universal stress UspA family protein
VTATFPRVACCVDDSDAAERALREAARLRRGDPGDLSVVHVAPPEHVLASGMTHWPADPDEPLRPVRAWLDGRAAAVRGARAVLLSSGDPAGAVCAWAREARPDLLVAAAHGSMLQRAVLGSFTNAVIECAPCPVLVVRPEAPVPPEAEGAPYRHIVCCIDDSDASRVALATAGRLRRLGPGRLSLVHVLHPPPPLPRRLVPRLLPVPGGLARRRRRWLRNQARAVPGAESVLLAGDPPRVAVEWARRHGADLLIAGVRRSWAERMLLGSFARHLARHAPCHVLLVRPEPAAGTPRTRDVRSTTGAGDRRQAGV